MKSGNRPRTWFYVVTPLASVVLLVFVIEIALSLLRPVPFFTERAMYFVEDPFTGFKLQSNSTGYYQHEIPARSNESGHRDEFVPLEKPEGSFRVLVLGDSFTVGANVAQNEAYSEVLEDLLARDSERKVEVVNAGVSGWQPFQYAQYYEYYGRAFSPDLVLIGFFVGNDTYEERTRVEQYDTAVLGKIVSRKAVFDRSIHLKVFLFEHSNLARLTMKKSPFTGNARREDCHDFIEWHLGVQGQRLANHEERSEARERMAQNSIDQIKRIVELAASDSAPVIVVLIPDENQINTRLQRILLEGEDTRRFDFDMPQSMLKEMFVAEGIPVIDLLPFFRKDSRCLLYMNDTHWSPEGHVLGASAIHESLIEMELWRALGMNPVGSG